MRRLQTIAYAASLCLLISCSKKSGGNTGGGTTTPPPTTDPKVLRGAWVTTTASTALNSRAEI
ncbi:MAG TPA: hypothetical protein VM871_05395, partial [Flavisolibacter sp.]|nr:hypothetical protein [Flavisolibacter sp.]